MGDAFRGDHFLQLHPGDFYSTSPARNTSQFFAIQALQVALCASCAARACVAVTQPRFQHASKRLIGSDVVSLQLNPSDIKNSLEYRASYVFPLPPEGTRAALQVATSGPISR